MTTFTLGKLTPLNSKRHNQKDNYLLSNLDTQSELTAQSLEGLAKNCQVNKREFLISERDEVQCYEGPAKRIFPNNRVAYVLSSPTPKELAEFLWGYQQNNCD